MLRTTKLITTAAVAALAGGFSAQAAGAPGPDGGDRAAKQPRALEVLVRPAERLEHSIEVHEQRLERQRRRREAREPDFATPESYGVSQSTLDAIASCESGGDPAAVSSDGTYRGKYQFDAGTWASMGGSGDPATAPEAEQDMRARALGRSAASESPHRSPAQPAGLRRFGRLTQAPAPADG
jgi:hypothetical protein